MIVQAPDGKNIDFGNLPVEQVQTAMQKLYPPSSSQQGMVAQDKVEMGSGMSGVAKQLGAYGMNAIQGLPGGTFSDEAISGLGAAFGGGQGQDFSQRYADLQQRQQAFRQAGQELNPGATAMGTIGTGLATAPLMPGAGPAKTLMGAMAKGGATGAAYGEMTGAGQGNAFEDSKDSAVQRIINGAGGAALGGVLGVAIPAAGGLIKKSGQTLGWTDTPEPPPSGMDIKSEANQYYKTSKDLGAVFNQNASMQVVDEVEKALLATGKNNARLHGDTLSVVDDLKSAAENGNLSLEELDQNRQLLNQVVKKNLISNPADAFKANVAIDAIDNFVENSGNKQLVSGDATAIDALNQGRALWSKAAKVGTVEKIMDHAEMTDNPATAIKNGFRTLANNDKRFRGFTPEEKQIVKNIAGSNAGLDILRTFGSRLMGIISGATGAGVGGTAAAQGISMASRGAATRMQMNKAQGLINQISGYDAPPVSTGFPVTAGGVQSLDELMRQQ